MIIEIDVDACIKGTVRTGMQVTVYDTWNLDSLPTEIASCCCRFACLLLARVRAIDPNQSKTTLNRLE